MNLARYDPLPGITSPRPEYEMQQRFSSYPNADNRNQNLELRLAASENSNRVMLDEMNSLKNEIRMFAKKYDDTMRVRMDEQQRYSENMRQLHDSLMQMAAKIRRNEEQISTGQQSFGNVIEQLKRMQQAIYANQQNMNGKSDSYESRITELHNNLEENKGERLTLAKTTYDLTDKIKSIEMKVDAKNNELTHLATEIKKKTLHIEDSTRSMLDQFRLNQDYQNEMEYSSNQLKNMLDNRISEFQGILNDVRGKQLKEESDRRSSDQLTSRKLSEMIFQMTDLQRSCEDLKHEQNKLRADLTSAYDNERLKMQDQHNRYIDEVKRKLYENDSSNSQKLDVRLNAFETIMTTEREARVNNEKSLREAIGNVEADLKDKIRNETSALAQTRKNDKNKISDSLNVLNEAINVLERNQDEWFQKITKHLRNEISAREKLEENSSHSVKDLDEKFAKALSYIKDDISRNGKHSDKLVSSSTPENHSFIDTRKSISDLDNKVHSLSKQLEEMNASIEERLKNRVARSNIFSGDSTNLDRISDTLQQVTQWYETSSKQVSELNTTVFTTINPKIEANETAIKDLQLLFSTHCTTNWASEIAIVENKIINEIEKITAAKGQIEQRLGSLQIGHEKAEANLKETKEVIMTAIDENVGVLEGKIFLESKARKTIGEEMAKLNEVVEDIVVQANNHKKGDTMSPPTSEFSPRQTSSTKMKKQLTEFLATPKTYDFLKSLGPSREQSLTKPDLTRPSIAIQTIESYLAGITTTNGHPTLAIQTGKSLLSTQQEYPNAIETQTSFEIDRVSPGIGNQTSFASGTISTVKESSNPPELANDESNEPLVYSKPSSKERKLPLNEPEEASSD